MALWRCEFGKSRKLLFNLTVKTGIEEILIRVPAHGFSPGEASLACAEVLVAVVTIVFSICLERYVKETLAAQFRFDDAEMMVAGFRRMLRGICDGEVLLDGQLQIQGPGACLGRMLSTNADFDAKPFVELLADADQQARFQDFIASSARAAAQPDVQRGLPPCLRVSLLGTSGSRVGADLFHVPLSRLFGSGDSYHLLAMRQDAEPVPLPDAPGEDMSRQTISEALTQPVASASQSHDTSCSSGASACSLLQTLPQLTEMMILIDTTKRHQDVCQVHLNYEETEHGDAGMPNLRKFIRPTDWEPVRSRVRHYAQKVAEDPSIAPKYFSRGVWFRMLDDPRKYMRARLAKLTRHTTSGAAGGQGEALKLWLYLTDFAVPDAPPPSELESIHESED